MALRFAGVQKYRDSIAEQIHLWQQLCAGTLNVQTLGGDKEGRTGLDRALTLADEQHVQLLFIQESRLSLWSVGKNLEYRANPIEIYPEPGETRPI